MMLKTAPSIVLGLSNPSTYEKSTRRVVRALRPRWIAVLSIIKFIPC